MVDNVFSVIKILIASGAGFIGSAVIRHLIKYTDHGVQMIIHYPIPQHKQQVYKESSEMSFPISEQIHNEVFSLLIGSHLNFEDINLIIQICNEFKN